jgi:single-strand DNA-binding protein
MSINNATISGNIVRDPELKQTRGGMSVMTFSVAVNDRRKNQSGEWEDYPNYIDCTMFGTRAEKLSRFIGKGSKVSVQGRIHQDRWQDKQTGQNRSKVGVIVDQLEFMSRGNQQGQQAAPQKLPQVGQAQTQQVQQPIQGQGQQDRGQFVYDADIPF